MILLCLFILLINLINTLLIVWYSIITIVNEILNIKYDYIITIFKSIHPDNYIPIVIYV